MSLLPFRSRSSLTTAATLKILCLPIGAVTPAQFQSHLASLQHIADHLDPSRLTDTNASQSSPFQSFNSPDSRLAIELVTLADTDTNTDSKMIVSRIQSDIEWEEYHPHRHVFAMIGIASKQASESAAFQSIYSDYSNIKEMIVELHTNTLSSIVTSSNNHNFHYHSLPLRCQLFAFDYDDTGGSDDAIVLPSGSDDRSMSYLSACLHGLLFTLVHDTELLIAEIQPNSEHINLKCPLDNSVVSPTSTIQVLQSSLSQSSLSITSTSANNISAATSLFESLRKKGRKQRIGRQEKFIGDLCLIYGCVSDALTHYRQSIELLKSTGDSHWLAAVYQAQAAALFAAEQRQSPSLVLPLNDSVVMLLTDSLSLYQRSSGSSSLCVEVSFQLARYFAYHGHHSEAMELLMKTHEMPLDLSAHDSVEFSVECAIIAAEMGQYRKFGLLIVQAASLYEELHQFRAAAQLLKLAMPVYHLHTVMELTGTDTPCDTGNTRKGWPRLQRLVLEHFIYNSLQSDDKLMAARAMIALLHCDTNSHPYTSDSRDDDSGDSERAERQMHLVSSLMELTQSFASHSIIHNHHVPVLHSLRLLPLAEDRQVRTTANGTTDDSDGDTHNDSSNNVFLFSPDDCNTTTNSTRTGRHSQFAVHEPIQFELSLTNPLSIPLAVQSLQLCGSGSRFHCPIVSTVIPARVNDYRLVISITPSESGMLSIDSCRIQCFNLISAIHFTEHGSNSHFTHQSATSGRLRAKAGSEHSISLLRPIEVVESVPSLQVSLTDALRGTAINHQQLIENEVIDTTLTLLNDSTMSVNSITITATPLYALHSVQSQASYYTSRREIEAEKSMARPVNDLNRLSTETLSSIHTQINTALATRLPINAQAKLSIPVSFACLRGWSGLRLSVQYHTANNHHYRVVDCQSQWTLAPSLLVRNIEIVSVSLTSTMLVMHAVNPSTFPFTVELTVDGLAVKGTDSYWLQRESEKKLIFTLPKLALAGGVDGDIDRLVSTVSHRVALAWTSALQRRGRVDDLPWPAKQLTTLLAGNATTVSATERSE